MLILFLTTLLIQGFPESSKNYYFAEQMIEKPRNVLENLLSQFFKESLFMFTKTQSNLNSLEKNTDYIVNDITEAEFGRKNF